MGGTILLLFFMNNMTVNTPPYKVLSAQTFTAGITVGAVDSGE